MKRGELLMITDESESAELDHELVEDIQGRMILHWNYRNLKELPKEVLNHGEHIEEIYLKRNCLEKLPPDIGKLRNLTNLYLVGNQLETLPEEIGDLKSLRVLDVSQNYIKQLPNSIGNLDQLESLLLTYNQLQELPKCLKKLHRLKQLEISGNRIYHLPEEVIGGLKSVEEFGIDRNPISSIPRNICQLHNLRYFSACRCNLLLLPSLPFLKLVHGSCQRNRGQSSAGNRNLQFLFDGNPRLNYIPYWVLQLLGTSVECFGCGLEPAEGDNDGGANPPHHVAAAAAAHQPQTQLQLYIKHSDVNRPKIKLNFKGKRRTLHFDEDLRHIHHHGFSFNEEPSSVKIVVASLFEICLRQIHHLGLLDDRPMPITANPVVEPLIVPQKAGKPLINIKGDFQDAKKEESGFMDIDLGIGAMCTSAMQGPSTLCHHPKPSSSLEEKTGVNQSESNMSFILPTNLARILKKGPVARCFQCLRPIFTETWPIIFNIPKRVHGDNPGENENEIRGDWDDRQVDGNLSICCTHFCGASCVAKFRAGALLIASFRINDLKRIIDNELSWTRV